jgi:hypothetical protein
VKTLYCPQLLQKGLHLGAIMVLVLGLFTYFLVLNIGYLLYDMQYSKLTGFLVLYFNQLPELVLTNTLFECIISS